MVKEPHKTLSAGGTRAVAIGASAGAVDALLYLLPRLGSGFPFSVFVVVHVPADGTTVLSDLFSSRCLATVREAEDKEPISTGVIYFAPPNYHLLIESDFTIVLSVDEPVLFSRPSVDVLFESAADAYGSNVMGVVLTGGNSDGAAGLAAIYHSGGRAVVQDPREAYAQGMPEAALATCPQASCLTLSEIAVLFDQLAKVNP